VAAGHEDDYPADIRRAAARIVEELGEPPRLGVVLGSGIGAAGAGWEITTRLAYTDIPGFAVSTVAGHAGEMLLGRVGGTLAAVMSGRAHFYESGSMDGLTFAIRTLAATGIATLVLTNSAGGVAARMKPGTIVLIEDHLALPALAGGSSLVGPNVGPGPRFPAMAGAYDAGLREAARRAADKLGIAVAGGVYAMVGGPNFETPAEVRMLATLGADVVGMSTAAEAIVARHAGLRVLGISVVTNRAGAVVVGDEHAAVLAAAGRAAKDVARIVGRVAEGLERV
jgi:purine-nucleoside phosphorylase